MTRRRDVIEQRTRITRILTDSQFLWSDMLFGVFKHIKIFGSQSCLCDDGQCLFTSEHQNSIFLTICKCFYFNFNVIKIFLLMQLIFLKPNHENNDNSVHFTYHQTTFCVPPVVRMPLVGKHCLKGYHASR